MLEPLYDMPDSLPPYEPTAAYSLGTAQSAATYFPKYSAASPPYWWEEAVQQVCQTSDPVAVNNALRLFPTPGNAIALLSKRGERWLNTCLEVICKARNIEVPPCNSLESAAQKIVDIITWRPPLLPWNGDWIISGLMGTTEISTIAERLDLQIQSMFSRTTVLDWVSWRFGYSNDSTNFLDTMIKVRNGLILYAQSHGNAKLTALLKALPSQQPLPRWVLSTAISCDTSSQPTTSLRFIIDPIEQLLTEQQSDFPLLIQHLLIIETRFKLKIVNSSDVTWSTPFSIDFSLWKSINHMPPRMLAELNAKAVQKLFLGISIQHIAWNDKRVTEIGKNWSDFSDDILACLNADRRVTGYVKKFAELSLSSSPRNIHSATAIGSALRRSGFQPCEPWAAWDIINPDNNFAGCVQLMAEGNCFPYLNRIVMEVLTLLALQVATVQPLHSILSKRWNTSQGILGGRQEAKENIILAHFEMGEQQNTSQGNLGGRQEVENTVQNRTYNENSPNYKERLPPSSSAIETYPVHGAKNSIPLKRKDLIGKQLPNNKRAAVGVNVCHPYFKRNQQCQDSLFRDPVPPLGNDTNHDLQGSTFYEGVNIQISSPLDVSTHSALERNSGIDKTHRDLYATQSNLDNRNSTTLCRDEYQSIQMVDPLLNNCRLPEIQLQASSLSTMTQRNPARIGFLLNPNPLPVPLMGSSPKRDFREGSSPKSFSQVPQVLTTEAHRAVDCSPMIQGPENKFSDTPAKKILEAQPRQRSGINTSLERPTPGTEKERVATVTDLSDADVDDFKLTYRRADGRTVEMIVMLEPCGGDTDEANPFCLHSDAVTRTTQDVLDHPSILGPEPLAPAESKHSQPPKQDFLASREASSSEVYSQEELIGHSPTIQRNSEPSTYVDEEQSDFLLYSNHDLGEDLTKTRTRFRQLFGKTASDNMIHLTQINSNTPLGRRRIACEAKSRLVDVAPHRASKYPWVENYHKQEIFEEAENLGRATLSSVEREHLRPFSAEALDFLWFLHFDLGISAALLLDTFRGRYSKGTVGKAHLADFKRRGITLSCGYTARLQMRTGSCVMYEAYTERYRLCDIRPDAIQYGWIPTIFKFGIKHLRFRYKAFQQFYHLVEGQRIELITGQRSKYLTFPGLGGVPESTFHRLGREVQEIVDPDDIRIQESREQTRGHVTSPRPVRKICTRSCAGCFTCKSEGGKCDRLQ